MLRQAVRMFLQQQNRLTYCSLQGTVRRLHSKYQSQIVQCRIRYVERTYVNTMLYRPLHVTCICASVRKELRHSNLTSNSEKLVTGTEMDNLVMEDRNGTDMDVKKETIAIDLKKEMVNVGNEDYETVRDDELHLYNVDLKLYKSGNDAEDNNESWLSELIPLANENIQMVKTSRKTLIPSQGFYEPKSIIQSLLDEDIEATDIVTSERSAELAAVEEDYLLKLAEKGELQVKGIEKVELPTMADLTPFVNETEVLRQLVILGVDLTVIQKTGMIERVMTMDFKKDVGPYVWFLKDCGVTDDEMGKVITRCPWIFQHDVRNLRVRIDYLLSKKFKKDGIANMINRDPKFLLVPVERIDAKLGFLQKEFKLTGNQIREKVSGLSKLVIAKSYIIKESKFYMKKMLGFTESELKTMFLAFPKIFLKDLGYVTDQFDYLHNVMELPHELIAKNPKALNSSRQRLRSRHRFLVKCGRAQYDPTQPNYVSLQALTTQEDEIWCLEVAKASVAEYNQFLRLI